MYIYTSWLGDILCYETKLKLIADLLSYLFRNLWFVYVCLYFCLEGVMVTSDTWPSAINISLFSVDYAACNSSHFTIFNLYNAVGNELCGIDGTGAWRVHDGRNHKALFKWPSFVAPKLYVIVANFIMGLIQNQYFHYQVTHTARFK